MVHGHVAVLFSLHSNEFILCESFLTEWFKICVLIRYVQLLMSLIGY